MENTVSIEPIVDFVLPILGMIISTIIAVFLPILLTKLAAKFNLQIEQQKRDALQTTLTNAAGGLLQQLGTRAKDVRITIADQKMRDAVQRVINGAPDAVKWAGLNEAEIARRILEKLPQIESPNAPTLPAPVSDLPR